MVFNFFIPRSLQTSYIKKATNWFIRLTRPLAYQNLIIVLAICSTNNQIIHSVSCLGVGNGKGHCVKKVIKTFNICIIGL